MTKLECIVKAMDDKLAQDIVAINMENASPLYDTFILCTASNKRLLNAIQDNVVDQCEMNGFEIKSIEGRGNAEWILIDAGDVICHIFSEEAGKEYNLEKLWSDMPTIDIKEYLA